jgi:gliding motility-associated-like protein
VYVSNALSNDISVINTQTNSVIATIPTGVGPYGLCVSPDGSKIYVSNDVYITVIDAATYTVIGNILFGEYPGVMALSPDGSKLYVTNNYGDPGNKNDDSNFVVINTATNAVIATIEVGEASGAVAVSPDGSRLYVANIFSNNISVIDAVKNVVVATIPVDKGPLGLAISPDGSRLYVTDSGDQSTSVLAPGKVSVINTLTNTVITTIPVDTYPIGISVTPDGSEVYVANDFGKAPPETATTLPGTVSVINTANNTVKATIQVGFNAGSLGNFISNYAGCPGVPFTFTITVNPAGPAGPTGDIVIPNTFTPNNDGINDLWDIKYLATYANCTVQVFNRWGQNVYSSLGYETPWDGTYKHSPLPTGTYYYIIDLKTGAKPYSGFVAIIR